MTEQQASKAVHVPTGLNLKTRFFSATAGAWRRLSALESAVLRDEIERIEIDRPIYVTGVPRAGTTITTEILERHPDVTSHRYSDFPNVYTPYWRNWLAEKSGRKSGEFVERSHGDRIMVTSESPEAVEEVIWMQFFGHLHDAGNDQVLDEHTNHAGFESFYRDHIRKLLAIRGASRYLAKGNYNITRLRYLLKIFPNARFAVVVRHPVNHVASLLKQDLRFQEASREDSRVPGQLASSGHFEFGPHQRAINTGNARAAAAIEHAWSAGERTEGWARYWASAYRYLLDRIEADKALQEAVTIVHYERLCRKPEQTIRDLLEHCRLDPASFEPVIEEYSGRISPPTYYQPDFNEEESMRLLDICGPVARRLGYEQ
ncbi:MAG: sulfotransferase [Xanthomonadales bacterium]|nr:sulfotransferase [Xanthomonadales bacterium]